MSPKEILILFAAAFVIGACGGSSSTPATPSTSSSTTTTPTGSATPTITIVGQSGSQAFSPNPASFGGQQIVFKNSDTVTHRVVLNDGSVDTGDIAPGATSKAVLMPTAGANYHCSLHTTMVGAVSGDTGTPPPACSGPYC